jgi:membrane protein involved in colicin uptake
LERQRREMEKLEKRRREEEERLSNREGERRNAETGGVAARCA